MFHMIKLEYNKNLYILHKYGIQIIFKIIREENDIKPHYNNLDNIFKYYK